MFYIKYVFVSQKELQGECQEDEGFRIVNYKYPWAQTRCGRHWDLGKYDVSEVTGSDTGFGSRASVRYTQNNEEASTRLFISTGKYVVRRHT